MTTLMADGGVGSTVATGSPAARTRAARRVLFAMTTDYLPESTGGVESTTHELCLALPRHGWMPSVLAGCRRNGRFARRAAMNRLIGRGPFCRDDDLGYATYRCRRPLRALDALCAAIKPDLAVVQLGRIVPLARDFVERGVPTVLFVHNLNFAQMGGALFRHALLHYATVSEFMALAVAPHAGVRPSVVLPLIDPAAYRAETDRSVVTFVNPTAIKGLAVALHLAARRPDIPFEFVESWPLRRADLNELRRAIARLPNVRFLPRTGDMRGVYARSRVLLAPSQWEEPWGRVAGEAQINGIPVLASRTGGLPEAVGPGGILVEPQDLAAWESALAAAWDDPRRYDELARQARAHAARREMQPDAVLRSFLQLLDAHAARTAPA
jgi:glycosyltransferase involved in cell wall biosynthesis